MEHHMETFGLGLVKGVVGTCPGVNTHHAVRIHLIYCGRWHWEDFTSAGYLHIRKG